MELFKLKSITKIRLLPDKSIYSQLSSILPCSSTFEAQGELHEDLDIALVDKIDGFVKPLLGDYEKTDRWFHNVSLCNGDGVRGISIDIEDVTNDLIIGLQGTLVGQHVDFCAFCNVYENHSSEDSIRIGALIIKSNEVVVSSEINSRFGVDSQLKFEK